MWVWFTEVFNPGGVGNGPYRTEYREIEAYARCTRQEIRPTEARMIRDLCEDYLRVWTEYQTPSKAPPGTKNLTKMTDNAGLKAIFTNQGDRLRSKTSLRRPAKSGTKSPSGDGRKSS